MGKVGSKRRNFQITKNRQRHAKLLRLREKYAAAKTAGERQAVISKIKRIAPHLSAETYLGI